MDDSNDPFTGESGIEQPIADEPFTDEPAERVEASPTPPDRTSPRGSALAQLVRSEGPVGQTTDEGQGRIFPCESCGADLEFEIGAQKLSCPFCGRKQTIELDQEAEVVERDFHQTLERIREQRRDKIEDATTTLRTIRCESCGSEVVFCASLKSTECAYCGSPIQEDSATHFETRVPVDGVMPFRVTEDRAEEKLAEWAKKLWFAPNAFKERVIREPFTGMYLPFWTFDSLTFTRYRGQRGETYTTTVGSGKNRRTVVRVRWYPASGAFQRFFDDVLVPAAKRVPRKVLRKLEPWALRQVVPFNEPMLAGFVAKTYEVELDDGFKLARERMREALTADVKRRIGGDQQRISSLKTRHDAITYKQLLLPVWMLTYKSREKKRSYRVFVNAVTGEVQGERPYSWIKITLAALAGLAIAGGIFLFSQSR